MYHRSEFEHNSSIVEPHDVKRMQLRAAAAVNESVIGVE